MNKRMKRKNLIFILLVLILPSVLALNISSPENKWYNEKTVPVYITNDLESDFYYSLNYSSRWVSLCADTLICNTTIRVREEGENNITIKSVNENGKVNQSEVKFMIDSKNPRILKQGTLDRQFVNKKGFFINYSEKNVKEITLFYNGENKTKNCPNSTEQKEEQECIFNDADIVSNLTSLDGSYLGFWFTITDIAGNEITSKRRTVVGVDTTDPVVKFNST